MNDNDDDHIAGEYVLGTLDSEERRSAAARRATDGAFDRAVSAWEGRLAPLDEATPEADVPGHLWGSILARIVALGGAPGRGQPDQRVVVLSRQLHRWRQVAALTTALAAAMALWIAIAPIVGSGRQPPQMIAVLLKGGEEPAYLMSLSLHDDTVAIRPVSARVPEGKSYELWVIDPSIGAPRSLGTLDPKTTVHKVPGNLPPEVVSRATYAVTIEPPGGSPTGAPSGAPVFVGHAVEAP